VDEIPAAAVDQRAVVMRCCGKDVRQTCSQLCRGVCLRTIIIVYHNTSLYINGNEVEVRLGTIMQVYARYIKVAYS
jgi:hypothetical protein